MFPNILSSSYPRLQQPVVSPIALGAYSGTTSSETSVFAIPHIGFYNVMEHEERLVFVAYTDAIQRGVTSKPSRKRDNDASQMFMLNPNSRDMQITATSPTYNQIDI
jgi:hypothetical protein